MPSRVRILATALLLAACGGGHGLARGSPAPAGYGSYDEAGLASWYGDEVAGSRTASGDRFDPDGVTVAHRTLPLGSWVEVTSLDTGRRVIARVNDRGPGRRDRLVDLSLGTARAIGADHAAVSRVRVRAVTASTMTASAPRPIVPASLHLDPGARYIVQVASFSNKARAQALAARLGADVVGTGERWRVRLGPLDAASAQRARDAVAARGYGDAQVLPTD